MLHTILQPIPIVSPAPSGATGDWYIATDVLATMSLEELQALNDSGATILASRRGYWNTQNPELEQIELFLWGTPEQLACAQEKLKLRTSIDALLNHSELYWG